MPPLIGVTCSTEAKDADAPPADRLAHTYTRAVLMAGGLPVLIPNVAETPIGDLLGRLDGLLLTGGRDVAPAHYGQLDVHPSVELDTLRDAVELPLIREAFERDVPILAICRGIQALNVALGGTLFQDLPSQRPGFVSHRQTAPRHEATHQLVLEPGSLAARALNVTQLRVNSFHHQGVEYVAPPLKATGYAEDGLIEAVEAEGRRFVLGVQYHPEEMVNVCESSRRLFRTFVTAANG